MSSFLEAEVLLSKKITADSYAETETESAQQQIQQDHGVDDDRDEVNNHSHLLTPLAFNPLSRLTTASSRPLVLASQVQTDKRTTPLVLRLVNASRQQGTR